MERNHSTNWDIADRLWLVNKLKGVVRWKHEIDRKIFGLVLNSFLDPSKDEGTLAADDVVHQLNLPDDPVSTKEVHDSAYRVRLELIEVSKIIKPNPAVSLSRAPYALFLGNDPGRFQKKYVEPCIGLLLADATDWFVGDLVKGVKSVCDGKYDLIVDVSNYKQKIEEKKIHELTQKVRGLLLVPVGDHVLKSAATALTATPCVLIDRYLTNLPNLACVHPDDDLAGRSAAHYLIHAQGCDRIIVVDQGSRNGNKFVISPLTDRADGCEAASGSVDVIHLPPAGTDERGGWNSLEEFEKSDCIRGTDGIFALTDRVAAGCRHYLTMKHPKDFDVNRLISTEGQAFGDFMLPALVSIKFNNFEMGRQAAELLLEKIEGRESPEPPNPPRYPIGCELLLPSDDPIRRRSIPLKPGESLTSESIRA